MTSAADIARMLAPLAPADRATIWRLLPSWVQRERRLCERDEAIRALAEHYRAASGRQLARDIHHHLSLYAAAGRLSAPVPADARRALLHSVLALSDGRIPAPATLRRALAGVGSNSPEVLSHGQVSTAGETDLEVA